MPDPRLIIVSNRVPPRSGAQPGGLAVALETVLAHREALWFGWSGDIGDQGVVEETVDNITYAQRDLSPQAYEGFYNGLANGCLWPLMHSQPGNARFRRREWRIYQAVNAGFASDLKPLLRSNDLVWVHDYHLMLMGASLRAQGYTGRIGFFLHIPFPGPDLFDNFPESTTLLQALCAYDLIGVQTERDRQHLVAALTALNLFPHVEVFPIGIDPQAMVKAAIAGIEDPQTQRLRQSLGHNPLILGVDRLDYSKGIRHRFEAFSCLLQRFPEHREAVTMLQVAPVSRPDVLSYQQLRADLESLVGRINGIHGSFDWTPVRFLTQGLARTTLAGFHRAAQVGIVSPLRDGMNLVAKEYVAAQDPANPGVLVLSRFAGAQYALDGAVLIHPFDPDAIADGLHAALKMPADERIDRWNRMYQGVCNSTAEQWCQRFLAALTAEPLPPLSTEIAR